MAVKLLDRLFKVKKPDFDIEKPGLDDRGAEVGDPVPLEPPVGYKKHPSLTEQIRDMVRSEALRREAEAAGAETFEEADDFEIADDPIDPSTPYEQNFEGGSVRELREKREADLAEQERLRLETAQEEVPAERAPKGAPKVKEAPAEPASRRAPPRRDIDDVDD